MLKALIEFMPLAAFLIAYSVRDIYAATAALMITMPLMLLLLKLTTGRAGTMPIVSTVLVLVFGALTLLLHDPRFIQWKATLYLWGIALVMLGNVFIGRELLVRQLLGPVAEDRQVTDAQWRALNAWWIGVYFLLGVANLAFAYYAPEAVWAKFKVYGLTGALLVFLVAQTAWLTRLPQKDQAPA
jgi:intracellular septation protein